MAVAVLVAPGPPKAQTAGERARERARLEALVLHRVVARQGRRGFHDAKYHNTFQKTRNTLKESLKSPDTLYTS